LKSIRLHEWPTTSQEAITIQNELAGRIELCDNAGPPQLIAAVDTAYGEDGEMIYAAAVVTTFPEIEEVEKAFFHATTKFPYTPGLFYFREGPAIIGALSKLQHEPDLLIVHGHGIAHPRRCGTASMIGLAFDKPTIGCARKLLAGTHRQLLPQRGSRQPLMLQSKEVGIVFRTKDNVKPLFISPGHRCSLALAGDIVVRNVRGYRLPEPLRLAHLFANKYKRFRERKAADVGQSIA
jgi:deoxyribonuclease V